MNKKLDKMLISALSLPNKMVDCIIYALDINGVMQQLENQNIKVLGVFKFINAISVSISVKSLNSIAQNQYVKYISSLAKVNAMMNVSRQVLKVNSSMGGDNITIAYIDTGLEPHLDFFSPTKRLKKFVDLVNYRLLPYDDNGHGTFVCGVGSGNGLVSNGKYKGIAPRSNIVAIKALNENGEANATRILEAMQWIFDNHIKYGIKVVCMSFGSEPLGENDPIMKGAEELWHQNIIVVAAAGNSGPDYQTIKSPAISPKIITVGGLNDNRVSTESFSQTFFEIADFSSRGPALNSYKPDVVAPAVDITSCSTQNFYVSLSGTSVATPMIAGICALMLQKKPTLRPSEIKKILLKNSNGITFNVNKEGFGVPNFENILKNLE